MLIAPLVWIVFAQVPTVPLVGTVVGPAGEQVIGAELILVGLPSYDCADRGERKVGRGRAIFARAAGYAGGRSSPATGADPVGGESGVTSVGDPISRGIAAGG